MILLRMSAASLDAAIEMYQRKDWLQAYFFDVLTYPTYHRIRHVQFHLILISRHHLAYKSNQASYILSLPL